MVFNIRIILNCIFFGILEDLFHLPPITACSDQFEDLTTFDLEDGKSAANGPRDKLAKPRYKLTLDDSNGWFSIQQLTILNVLSCGLLLILFLYWTVSIAIAHSQSFSSESIRFKQIKPTVIRLLGHVAQSNVTATDNMNYDSSGDQVMFDTQEYS